MVFSSLIFLFIYLPVVLGLYFITPKKFRNLILFIGSLIFYAWGEPVYIVLMIYSTIIDYTHGMLVDKFRHNKTLSRLFLISSVVLNLSLLGFFKYSDLLINTWNSLGIFHVDPLNLALPIGISFYTFQTMSYTIDVYRNDAPVQKNIISFGAYVTLFPQLIAGPIVRFKDVAAQLDHRTVTVEKFSDGIVRFVIGLGKKVFLANNIGMLWKTVQQTSFGHMSAATAWLGMIAFSFQIYFDFSGYSDMAIGMGKMLGFDFLENFNYPYISKSITEFWKRWHMSLGTWFKEYVYIPLGGNRGSKARVLKNILLVWLLTGIWHGASWNFLLWGLYYGVILILEKYIFHRLLEKFPSVLKHAYALLIIVLAGVIFNYESLSDILTYFKTMFGFGSAGLIDKSFLYEFIRYLPMLVILVIASTPLVKNLVERYKERAVIKVLTPVACGALLIICTAYLVDSSYNPFLYFRF